MTFRQLIMVAPDLPTIDSKPTSVRHCSRLVLLKYRLTQNLGTVGSVTTTFYPVPNPVILLISRVIYTGR